MIDMAEEKIREEFNAGEDFEQKLAKAKSEIREIHHNIGVVITEQRDLIINRHSLTDLYIDTIKKSFEFSFEKRYDFEETILKQLERYTNVLDNCLSLLKPLLLPDIGRIMCIGDIYEAQTIFKEAESQDSHLVLLEEYDDSEENERIRRISDCYVDIIALIISAALQKGETSLGAILDELRNMEPEQYERVVEDRRIFLVALKLYDIERVPVSDFYQNRKRVLMKPSEEFNIEYCLVRIKDMVEGLNAVKELIVSKAENEIDMVFEKNEDEIKVIETIKMTDIIFRVVK